jgi:hypothetical protein
VLARRPLRPAALHVTVLLALRLQHGRDDVHFCLPGARERHRRRPKPGGSVTIRRRACTSTCGSTRGSRASATNGTAPSPRTSRDVTSGRTRSRSPPPPRRRALLAR